MRAFLGDIAAIHLHRVLWLPPSLPAQTLGHDFERARTDTKRLVFSSWAMAPRAIAVMASYDAERHYIPEPARAARHEAQLLNMTGTASSLFALLVPSATLAGAGDPLRYPRGDAGELLRAIEERLRSQVAEFTRNAPTAGPPQEIWYAAAPLLLNRQRPGPLRWLHGPALSLAWPCGLVCEVMARRIGHTGRRLVGLGLCSAFPARPQVPVDRGPGHAQEP